VNPEQLAEILEPALPKGDIVLTTGPLLGLGDHSVYTTLPERFSKLGYNVYLDKDNAASNDEIYDLLWARNPFIKGLSDKKPNAGYVRQGSFYEISNRLAGCRSIEVMERAHGLPGPYGIAPKIYYKPNPSMINLKNTVLVDFSAVSSNIGVRGLSEAIRMMNGRFRNAPMLQVLFHKGISIHVPQIALQSYRVSSIYEYLDMIHDCRAWIGSESGGQALAAATRGEHDVYDEEARPEVVCTSTPRTYNSRGYTFRGVDYRVTCDTDVTGDYHDPIETRQHVYENVCKIRAVEMRERARG
jgi:hypothetical protein